MDFIVWLPIIFRLINMIPEIQRAIASGGSVFDIVKALGPDFLSFFEQIGGVLSPGAPQQAKVELGVLKTFDPKRVKEIQEAMNEFAGIDEKLVVDGDYGQKTTAAVKKFQSEHGLDADGWAGHLTMEKVAELRGAGKAEKKAESKKK